MGFIVGIIKKILKLILYFSIFVAFILLIPNLPPYTKFTSIEIEPTQERVGPLAPNIVLNNAERLYEDKLLGPEAFQIWNDEVYTSLATGEIVKLSPGGHVTFVTKMGQPCTGLVQEHLCGRPLGFVIDEKNKFLYAADAYHGIWKINLITDKKQLLVSPRVAINGKTPKLFNSVALDKNGDLFWTESSSDFPLKDGILTVFADPNGRLLHYNTAKNESKVLLDNLWFPNSVVISPDNQFVLVSETNRYRLIKYYIDGPKKSSSEVFVAGLPGLPDNLRTLPDGSGVLIALYNVFDEEYPLLTKTMASAPLARKFLARLIRLIEIPLEFLNSQIPHYIFEENLYKIGHFASVSGLLITPPISGLVQIDWNGKIVASYYNNDSSIQHISDAIVYKDKLYIGCPHIQNYVAVVPAPPLLKKAFSKEPQIKEQPKVVPEQTKPKIQEKREVPKVTKPVAQNKPLPSENKPKQTTPPSEIKAEKQPEVKPRESQSKPNVVPKNTETPKVADVKPKVVPKETPQKPIPKEKAQPKVTEQVKNSETKPKQPESKPKVVPKEQEKPKVQKQEEPKTKPVSKESDPKPKSKEAEIKSKPSTKSDSQKASEKIIKEAKKVETNKPPKPIPVEEVIPSDTAKPSKEKLKVIKKSGPQEIPNPHL